MDGLLDGLRVLDLTQNVAGPFCTQILGDMGAEVVKVERPRTGDDTRAWSPQLSGQSATFLALNRNKRSICVDLGQPAGRDVVRRLAADVDVVIHSMKPGSAEALGVGAADLMAANPRLIYCAISAFGETGPLAALPGYDPLMQAFTGIMSVTGNEGDDPVRVSVSLIDMGTGMWAALGIFAAMLKRARTGRGMQVNASLLETGITWMTVFVATYLASGTLPRKLGSAVSMTAPYELFRTSDGHVFIAAGNDRLFAKVCEALECPALTADPRFLANADRVRNRPALRDALEQRTSRLTAREAAERLRRAGAPCSELHDVGQAIAHEQVRALGMLAQLPSPAAPELKVVPLPLRLDGERPMAMQPPPALGADTDAVLRAAGFDAAGIARLREQGAIA